MYITLKKNIGEYQKENKKRTIQEHRQYWTKDTKQSQQQKKKKNIMKNKTNIKTKTNKQNKIKKQYRNLKRKAPT